MYFHVTFGSIESKLLDVFLRFSSSESAASLTCTMSLASTARGRCLVNSKASQCFHLRRLHIPRGRENPTWKYSPKKMYLSENCPKSQQRKGWEQQQKKTSQPTNQPNKQTNERTNKRTSNQKQKHMPTLVDSQTQKNSSMPVDEANQIQEYFLKREDRRHFCEEIGWVSLNLWKYSPENERISPENQLLEEVFPTEIVPF